MSQFQSKEPVLPLPIVVPQEGSVFEYPEVSPGADAWLWSDTPALGTLTVTEDGLRRLLRLISNSHGVLFFSLFRDKPELAEAWKYDVTSENLQKLLDESSKIFCEGSLVMSRLFVDGEGRAVAHPDEEVDKSAVEDAS